MIMDSALWKFRQPDWIRRSLHLYVNKGASGPIMNESGPAQKSPLLVAKKGMVSAVITGSAVFNDPVFDSDKSLILPGDSEPSHPSSC